MVSCKLVAARARSLVPAQPADTRQNGLAVTTVPQATFPGGSRVEAKFSPRRAEAVEWPVMPMPQRCHHDAWAGKQSPGNIVAWRTLRLLNDYVTEAGEHDMGMEQKPSAAWHRLASAISYALDIHATQLRKGTDTPYIGHLLAVASIVLEAGGDEEQAMAGVLHDAVEDIGAEQAGEIAARFGARVARIVAGCTDADTLPKPPWQARKEAYLQHLDAADPEVLLVSCADKLHNARSINSDVQTVGSAVFERFKAGRNGTLWYYRELADRFSRLLPGALARDLALAVSEMERLAARE